MEEDKDEKEFNLNNLLKDVVGKKELKQILDDAPEWAKFVLVTNYVHVEEYEHEDTPGEIHGGHDIMCPFIAFYNADEDSALGMITRAQRILLSEDS